MGGRCGRRVGFFDDGIDGHDLFGERRAFGDDAVAFGVFARHVHHAQHALLVFFKDFHHLPHHGFAFVDDKVVGQQDGKGTVAHDGLGAEDGMPQPHRHFLTDVGNAHVARLDAAHQLQEFFFAALFQLCFQLVGDVVVFGNCPFVAACYEDHVADARFVGFFDRVLNQRFIDDRQHFFRRCLGRGQKARAKSGDREHGKFYGFTHGIFSYRDESTSRAAASVATA